MDNLIPMRTGRVSLGGGGSLLPEYFSLCLGTDDNQVFFAQKLQILPEYRYLEDSRGCTPPPPQYNGPVVIARVRIIVHNCTVNRYISLHSNLLLNLKSYQFYLI